jgi:hypothetical protein
MVPLTQKEQDHIADRILEQLSQTPYACTSLTQLQSGVNFIFRGVLAHPLDNISTVIVKHFTDLVAGNWAFPLDVSRCVSFASLTTNANSIRFMRSLCLML